MTEQELLKKIGTLTTPEHLLECAKAYADARVAQECKVLDEVVTLLHQTIANRNVEIVELKAILSQAQQMYTDLLVGTTDAIAAKEAEIKRLRDAIQSEIKCFEFNPIIIARLESYLSPAPVTETLNEEKQ